MTDQGPAEGGACVSCGLGAPRKAGAAERSACGVDAVLQKAGLAGPRSGRMRR